MARAFKEQVSDFIKDTHSKGYDRVKIRRVIEAQIRDLYAHDSEKFDEVAYTLFKMLKIPVKDRRPSWEREGGEGWKEREERTNP